MTLAAWWSGVWPATSRAFRPLSPCGTHRCAATANTAWCHERHASERHASERVLGMRHACVLRVVLEMRRRKIFARISSARCAQPVCSTTSSSTSSLLVGVSLRELVLVGAVVASFTVTILELLLKGGSPSGLSPPLLLGLRIARSMAQRPPRRVPSQIRQR